MALNRLKPNKLNTWSLLAIFCLSLLLFLLPTNLFIKCCEQSGYVSGLFIDYLIPKLYLTHLVALSMIFTWLIGNRDRLGRSLKKQWHQLHQPVSRECVLRLITLGLWLAIGIRQFFAPNPTAAIWWYAQATLFGITSIVLVDIFRQMSQSTFARPFWRLILLTLAGTIIFQSSIALFQTTQQRSLADYWFLGEATLSQPLGLAKTVTTTGEVRILPYGTTAHPNVLAGTLSLYLVIMYLIQARWRPLNRQMWWLIWGTSLILGGATIWLTQSISAMLTLGIGLLVVKKVCHAEPTTHNKRDVTLPPLAEFQGPSGSSIINMSSISPLILSLLAATLIILAFILIPLTIHYLAQIYPDNLSLVRRDRLQTAAVKLTQENLLFGVGLNNFTVKLEEVTPNQELARFVQPVHHAGWLWISETGILGVMFIISALILLLQRAKKPKLLARSLLVSFLICLPIITLDHYLITLSMTSLLYVIVATLCFKFLCFNSVMKQKTPKEGRRLS